MKHVLLLHGAIGSASQLEPLREKLSDRYHVHLLDFPGHGGAEVPDSFSIPSFATFLKQFCDDKKLTQISVFGYSMGGYVALYAAKKYPGLIERIATLATKFHWTEEIAAKEIKMLQPDIIQQKLPQFATALQERHGVDNWKKLLETTAAMLVSMGNKNLLQLEDYTSVNIPVLTMLGDRDKMVSLEETVSVYKQLPNGQLALLPATPHPIEAVDMDLLAVLLKKFIG